MKKRVVLTGGNGCVGQRLLPFLSQYFEMIVPSHSEMDVSKKEQVLAYMQEKAPAFIIHAAAAVNSSANEKERGDTSGIVWKTNVEGTRNISDAAKKTGSFVLHISTGSVFSGSRHNPGPFSEANVPSDDDSLSWYAVTKKRAEEFIENGAIIRLSHPIGGRKTAEQKMDYLERMLLLYEKGQLYPLFSDVSFPLSYFPDVAQLLRFLIEHKKKGMYHPVSATFATPHAMFLRILSLRSKNAAAIRSISFADFIVKQETPMQYSQYYALDGNMTVKKAMLPVRSWEEVVDLSFVK